MTWGGREGAQGAGGEGPRGAGGEGPGEPEDWGAVAAVRSEAVAAFEDLLHLQPLP